MPRNEFFNKFVSKLDAMDSASINSYIHLLSREHGFLESVFNSIMEGIVVIDRSFKLIYHNAVAKEMFGIPDDFEHIRISHLVRGISWAELVSPDKERSRSACHEVEILYPKRRILKFYVASRPDSEQEFATLIFNDITDTYDRMNSAAESERTQLVSMLAAEVAHEIGNPLNSLYLNLQLFQRMLAKGELDKESAAEMIGESRKEVERLDSIIHQFLQALRPSKPNMRVLDIKNVMLESLTFMRHEIEGRGITVNCLWSDALPKIRGDADQLKQAFYNLIKNAVQAMPQGGSLTVSCSSDDRSVFVEIADKGRGIRQEDAAQLFKPFFTTKEKGNGLGLMVVERVVREHGGRLSFESKVGEGTKFTIALPRMGARIRVLPPPPDAPKAGVLPEPDEDKEHLC